jgi:hypothetical protein
MVINTSRYIPVIIKNTIYYNQCEKGFMMVAELNLDDGGRRRVV